MLNRVGENEAERSHILGPGYEPLRSWMNSQDPTEASIADRADTDSDDSIVIGKQPRKKRRMLA